MPCRLGLNLQNLLFPVDFYTSVIFFFLQTEDAGSTHQSQDLLRFDWDSSCGGLRGGIPFPLSPGRAPGMCHGILPLVSNMSKTISSSFLPLRT